MSFFKKIILALLILALVFFLTRLPKTKAQDDEVNLYIKAEASADNGATWSNYSGIGHAAGNQTLNAKPGDTIQVRIKLWNTSTTENATNVVGTGTLTNSSYVASASLLDAGHYTGYFFAGSGAGAIDQVNLNTDENTAEILLLSLTLSNNFPVGETIIIGEVNITNYGRGIIGIDNFLIDRARAEGVGRKSSFRIAVNVAAPPLPQTGAD